MKKIITLILVLFIAYTQASVAHTQEERRPKIGLVLSGGGARGAAHIGVIEVLEQLHVPIDFIVGTSMGAVIGGLYASGVPIEEIKYNFSTLDWEQMFNYDSDREYLYFRRKLDSDIFLMKNFISYSNGRLHLPWGIITGQSLYQNFNHYLLPKQPIHAFSQLPIPFKAVSTDLITGKPIVMECGDLALSMLASMAVPGIISPVEVGDYLLVDGGVSSNVPIQTAKSMGADIVIVVDVSTPLSTKAQIYDLTGVLGQLTNIMTHDNIAISKSFLTAQDILITPNLGEVGTSDFEKFAEGIQPGVIAADQQKNRLAALATTHLGPIYPVAQSQNPALYFNGVSVQNEHFLRPQTYHHYLNYEKMPLTPEEVAEPIQYLYGLSIYERIYYGFEEVENEKVLVVKPELKSQDPIYFQGSILIDSDFQTENSFGFILGVTNPQVNSLLGEWRVIAKIGQDFGVFAEFYQPLEPSLSWFVNPHVQLQRSSSHFYYDYTDLATVLDSSAEVGILFGREFSNKSRLGAFWQFNYDGYDVKEGCLCLPDNHSRNGQMGAVFQWDTVDNAYFPRTGTRGNVIYSANEKAFGGEQHFEQLRSRGLAAMSAGKHALVLAGKYNKTLSGEPTYNAAYSLGGLFQLTGLANGELLGNNAGLVSGIYFYNFKSLSLIPNRPAPCYLGASVESGKVWGETNLSENKFVYSGSVFIAMDSLLGPIYLAYGMTDSGRKAAHLVIRPAFK